MFMLSMISVVLRYPDLCTNMCLLFMFMLSMIKVLLRYADLCTNICSLFSVYAINDLYLTTIPRFMYIYMLIFNAMNDARPFIMYIFMLTFYDISMIHLLLRRLTNKGRLTFSCY